MKFLLEDGVSMMILTPMNFVGFKCSTFNVVQSDNKGFWIGQCQFQTMPIPKLAISRWVRESLRINQT
jgi:hypothetical protein